MKFDAILEWFNNIVKYIGPVIIIMFTLALFAGLIKWSYKTKENIKQVAKNPIIVFLWIVISILIIYLFYKYLIPLI